MTTLTPPDPDTLTLFGQNKTLWSKVSCFARASSLRTFFWFGDESSYLSAKRTTMEHDEGEG